MLNDNHLHCQVPETNSQRHLSNTNSPVDLDKFRALSNNISPKPAQKTSFSNPDCNDDEHEIQIRTWSEGSGIVITDTVFKDESVMSFDSSQKSLLSPTKDNHLRLDEKSSGYNSNQSTPTSEINSTKSNNHDQECVTKSNSKLNLGEVLVREKDIAHSYECYELIEININIFSYNYHTLKKVKSCAFK